MSRKVTSDGVAPLDTERQIRKHLKNQIYVVLQAAFKNKKGTNEPDISDERRGELIIIAEKFANIYKVIK